MTPITDKDEIAELESNSNNYQPEHDQDEISYLEKQAMPSGDHEQSFLHKLPRNILAGLAQGGHETLNLPYNIAKGLDTGAKDTLASKLGFKTSDIPHQQDYDYAQMLGLPTGDAATLSDKLIRGFAQYAPMLGAPEAELGSAGNLISKIPKIGNFLHKSARLGVPQAAYSAIQEPENPGKAAAIGLASGAIAPTLEGVVNALRPSSLLRGNLSPEQLAKNLDVTQGTETGLGR